MKRKAKRRKLSDCLTEVLVLPVSGEEDRTFLETLGIKPKQADNQMLIMARLMERAAKGDISAVREVRAITQEAESQDKGLLMEILEAVRNVG